MLNAACALTMASTGAMRGLHPRELEVERRPKERPAVGRQRGQTGVEVSRRELQICLCRRRLAQAQGSLSRNGRNIGAIGQLLKPPGCLLGSLVVPPTELGLDEDEEQRRAAEAVSTELAQRLARDRSGQLILSLCQAQSCARPRDLDAIYMLVDEPSRFLHAALADPQLGERGAGREFGVLDRRLASGQAHPQRRLCLLPPPNVTQHRSERGPAVRRRVQAGARFPTSCTVLDETEP